MTNIPKTRGLPRIGHLVDMGVRPISFLTKLQRLYPHLITVSINDGAFTLVTHPDLVEAVLVTQQKSFQKDKFLKLYAQPVFGNGLLSSDGDFWLRQRRMAQPAFHRARIVEYSTVMTRHGMKALADIPLQKWVDIHPIMMRLTLDIVAETLFTRVEASRLDAIGAALERIMDHYAGDKFMQILGQLLQRTLMPDEETTFRDAAKTFDDAITSIITERQTEGGDQTDLLGMFLAARDDQDQPMSTEQLRDECKTMFLAGHETTALSLSWTLWLLATHPVLQQRLAQEIAETIGNRPPTMADVAMLPFTEQVIRESMRLYPPAWVIQRESLTDVSLTIAVHTYHLPAEHDILVSPAAMHRDPRFYAHPDRFNPSRWTPEFIQGLPKYAYFPFGSGPRLCIGQQFALLEATLLLVQCIQKGNWQAHPLHPVLPQPSITQRPKYGIKLRCMPHR